MNGDHSPNGVPYTNGGRNRGPDSGVPVDSGSDGKKAAGSTNGKVKRKENMECRTPNMLRYRSPDGKQHEVIFPEEKLDRVMDLLEAEDWKALAKYHNGRPRL